MYTRELIKEVATSLDMPNNEVEKVFTCIVERLICHVQKNEKVSFGQLGKFSTKEMPERSVYDISMKQRRMSSAKRKVIFKPSTYLKEHINL